MRLGLSNLIPIETLSPNLMSTTEAPSAKREVLPHDLEQARIDQNLADLERLGRERPKCFPGAWSEISFCLSIFMSQILAVSHGQAHYLYGVGPHLFLGILHLRLERPLTYTRQGTKPSRSFRNMALHCTILGRHLDTSHLRKIN